MGPIHVVGLMYCGTCLRLRPKLAYDDGDRVRCTTACCSGYMRTIRITSLLKPAMAAYTLGGMPALRQLLANHPRVTCHRTRTADPRKDVAWMQFVPVSRKPAR